MSAPLLAQPPEDEVRKIIQGMRPEHDGGWGPLTVREIRLLHEESLERQPRPKIAFAMPPSEEPPLRKADT